MLLLSPKTGRKFISGLIFIFFLTGNAQAQVIHAIQVRGEDDWTLNAAVLNGHVIGFLATHDPSTIPTGSFANIWFERQSDNSFTAAGNVADSPTAVAARIELNKSVALFEQNELRDPSDPSAVTLTQFFIGPSDVTLTPMNKGLAEDDSFQSIVDQLNPEQMEFIVWQGAQGAVSLSAMTIAVNTCQLDPTDGTSAHGISQLESRLASLADYFDQVLAMSEEDWGNLESDGFEIARFISQQNCCEVHTEDWVGISVTCGAPSDRGGQPCHKTCYKHKTHYRTTLQENCKVTTIKDARFNPNPNPADDEAFDLELHPDCCVNQNLCPK